jgi:hypothetical protein
VKSANRIFSAGLSFRMSCMTLTVSSSGTPPTSFIYTMIAPITIELSEPLQVRRSVVGCSRSSTRNLSGVRPRSKQSRISLASGVSGRPSSFSGLTLPTSSSKMPKFGMWRRNSSGTCPKYSLNSRGAVHLRFRIRASDLRQETWSDCKRSACFTMHFAPRRQWLPRDPTDDPCSTSRNPA